MDHRASLAALALTGCIENGLGSSPKPASSTDTAVTTPTTPTVPGACDDTLSVPLFFPNRVDCPWGVDDNLDQVNDFNRARVDEVQDIVLPDGAQLCDLAVHSTTEDLLFDDHVTISLDDVALVGAGYGYDLNLLPVVANLRRYDWSYVVDSPFQDRSLPYWCIGDPDSVCVLPQTEVAGPLDIELSDAATADLVVAMAGRTVLPFRLTTFGDNDDDDCAHTDLTLQVDVGYTTP